jgi:hypothetical protein
MPAVAVAGKAELVVRAARGSSRLLLTMVLHPAVNNALCTAQLLTAVEALFSVRQVQGDAQTALPT